MGAPDRQKEQRVLSPRQFRWRFFWMSRSRARTVSALALAAPALLAAIYLALPASDQRAVAQAAQSAAQGLGYEGLTILVECVLIVFALSSFALLLAPGYRLYRYLPLPSSKIAPVTIYMDTENFSVETTDTATNKQMMQFMVNHVRAYLALQFANGRYADLLFFMDASHVGEKGDSAATKVSLRGAKLNWRYELLYRSGFRLIDSPHSPMGTNVIHEAVDKEIAMHALERALLGPERQEFIIIAEDGGYVPLIYRLLALGHSVQIWSPDGVIGAYVTLTAYFAEAQFKILDLSREAGKAKRTATSHEQDSAATTSPTPKRVSPARMSDLVFRPSAPPAVTFAQAEMNQLHYAIYNTVDLCEWIARHIPSADTRTKVLNESLGGVMKRHLAAVGYEGQGSSTSWLKALDALDALTWTGKGLPTRGSAVPEQVAQRLYALALAMAWAATQAPIPQDDNTLTTQAIRDRFMVTAPVADDTKAHTARTALDGLGVMYLLRCARALGLLEFDDVAVSRALIKLPRLTELATRLIEQEMTDRPPEQAEE